MDRAKLPPLLLAALLCLQLLPVLQIPPNSGHLAASAAPASAGLELHLARAERRRRVITVRKGRGGDFRSITDAVNSIPSGNTMRTIIKIGRGVYREKIVVDQSKPYVTFYGDRRAKPRISFGATAARYGTANSATVAVESQHFVACNIIFENTAPKPVDGVKGAQAVAMRISGNKAAFYNCKFYGYQDTLCDDRGKHFFEDCYIRGTVDFIFGNGRSIYQNCVIESVTDGLTYITAQGRSSVSDRSGFSFINCNITGTGSAFLGRAWRGMSRVVFSHTYMGSLVHPKGWDDKGNKSRDRTVFFGEYNCKGPGAATGDRVSYTKLLTARQANPFLSMAYINGQRWLLPPPVL